MCEPLQVSKCDKCGKVIVEARSYNNKEMKSHKEIYDEVRGLVSKVERLSPRLFNLGTVYSFHTKIVSLQIMQKHTLEKIRELFKAYEEEKTNSIYLKDTTRLLDEGIAFFEAYLNAFYSVLQIIGKVTPYFYDKETFL